MTGCICPIVFIFAGPIAGFQIENRGIPPATVYSRTLRLGIGPHPGAGIVAHEVLPLSEAADLTPKQVAQLAKVVKQEFTDESEDV